MSQVLSALGDTVGAVIDNEVSGNRWFSVIAGMSFPSPHVRLQKSWKRNFERGYVEQMLQNTSNSAFIFISSTPVNGLY
jgi:hypothetical protein